MSFDLNFIGILIGAIMASSVPLILAASGELITERSGVLNLGVEGMMIIGAISGFALMVITDNLFLAVIGSMLSGLIISIIFGVLTQSLLTNHVATGLALTIFGIGMSAMIGKNFVGIPGKEFPLLFVNLKGKYSFFRTNFIWTLNYIIFCIFIALFDKLFSKKNKNWIDNQSCRRLTNISI